MIRTSIGITDNLTPAFRHMTNAINLTISTLESLNRTVKKPIDVASLRTARTEMNMANEEMRKLAANTNRATESTKRYGMVGGNVFRGLGRAIGLVTAGFTMFQAAHFIVGTSDEVSRLHARLGLIKDDLHNVDELNGMIFASANRARGSYMDMANLVTRLRMNAPTAFGNNDEAIRFAELINKEFKISGATLEETRAATIQLSQALGSGVLRGEELNSVFEAAPAILQNIADYLNVDIGQIRTMAKEGKLTADVIKNAMFAAGSEIDAEFESIPLTWADRWQQAKNNVVWGLEETSAILNGLANSPGMDRFEDNLIRITHTISTLLAYTIAGVANMVGFVAEYWDLLGPPIMTVIGLIATYNATLMITRGLEIASAVAKGIMIVATASLTAVMTLLRGGTLAAAMAQWQLDTAMYACPAMWLVMAILVVVGAFFLLIAVINRVTGLNISAVGIIVGVWYAAGAIISNIFAFLLNVAQAITIGIWNFFVMCAEGAANAFVDFYNKLVDVGQKVAQCSANMGTAIANGIIKGVNLAIQALNHIIDWSNDTFGTSFSHRTEFSYSSVPKVDFSSAKLGHVDFSGAMKKPNMEKYQSITGAFMNGYNTGKGWIGDIKNPEEKYGDLLDQANKLAGQGTPNNPSSPGGAGGGSGVGKDIKDTAKNTQDIKDLMQITGENIEFLRDIAEKDVINRFTTAEIKIDMTNNNAINSDMDIDGITRSLVDKMSEAMEVAANGQHQ